MRSDIKLSLILVLIVVGIMLFVPVVKAEEAQANPADSSNDLTAKADISDPDTIVLDSDPERAEDYTLVAGVDAGADIDSQNSANWFVCENKDDAQRIEIGCQPSNDGCSNIRETFVSEGDCKNYLAAANDMSGYKKHYDGDKNVVFVYDPAGKLHEFTEGSWGVCRKKTTENSFVVITWTCQQVTAGFMGGCNGAWIFSPARSVEDCMNMIRMKAERTPGIAVLFKKEEIDRTIKLSRKVNVGSVKYELRIDITQKSDYAVDVYLDNMFNFVGRVGPVGGIVETELSGGKHEIRLVRNGVIVKKEWIDLSNANMVSNAKTVRIDITGNKLGLKCSGYEECNGNNDNCIVCPKKSGQSSGICQLSHRAQGQGQTCELDCQCKKGKCINGMCDTGEVLKGNALEFKRIAIMAAEKYGKDSSGNYIVHPALVLAIFKCGEHSSFSHASIKNGEKAKENLQGRWPNPYGGWATSYTGASGPFQFIRSTWNGYAADCSGDGTSDRNNLKDATCGAVKLLKALVQGSGCTINEQQSEEWSAAACYNGGGRGAVKSLASTYGGRVVDRTWWYANRVSTCYEYLLQHEDFSQ